MNVKADVSKDVKAAFLFGAGVEVDYGFPLGGELAVKLLSSDEIDKNAKDMVAQMLGLNSISNKKYFSRTDLKKLEKSMINNRQEEIKNYFAGFNTRIQNIFSEYEIDENKSISIENISFNMEIFNSKSDSNNKIRDIENFFFAPNVFGKRNVILCVSSRFEVGFPNGLAGASFVNLLFCANTKLNRKFVNVGSRGEVTS